MTDRLRAAAQAALEAITELDGYSRSAVTDKIARDAKQVLRAALAEPESDPCHVFSVTVGGGLCEWEPTTFAFAMRDGKHALYTTPPRREWVPLTDEERQQIIDSTHPDNRWTLAERVEYRLKEKNA